MNYKVSTILQPYSLPKCDVEILLATILQKDRTHIFAFAKELTCSAQQKKQIIDGLERLRSGEPVQYIVRAKEFYGLSFYVDERVLIPRPCTELLVTECLDCFKNTRCKYTITPIDNGIIAISYSRKEHKPSCIIDIGTGSGCIAISLAKALPSTRIIATDISPEAIEVAKKNATLLNVQNIDFRCEANFESVRNCQEHFFVVSNPPYIPNERKLIGSVVNFEPNTALFADSNGSAIAQKIVTVSLDNPLCVGLALECEKQQEQIITAAIFIN